MMRVRQRRPKHTREPRACRTARWKVRDWGNTSRQPAAISKKVASSVIGSPDAGRRYSSRCAGNGPGGRPSWRGRDEAFAIDGDAKGGVDTVQELGDVERRAGLFKYVKGHINLRQTFAASRPSRRGVTLAEASHGAQLSVKRGLKNA